MNSLQQEYYRMKTNQVLTIPFGGKDVHIEHLTMFGSLVDVFAAGNALRAVAGQRLIRHDQWLALEGTKDFIKYIEEETGNPAIRSKRGKGGGIWAHLYILLDAAAYLSPKLKYEMYDIFVQQNILEWRDRSGDNYIELNAMVALNAEEVFGRAASKEHYVTLANTIKSRCEVDAWNTAKPSALKERARIEETLASMLRLRLVRDWDHLKELASDA